MDIYGVTVTYSFDTKAQLWLFPNEKEAREYLKKDFENEKKIDKEENGYNTDCKIADDSTFASITNHFKNHDDITEWHITRAVLNSLKADDLPESVLWDAYNKAVVILTAQSVMEHFDTIKDCGVLPKDAVLTEEEAADMAKNLLYEDDCYPAMYDRIEAELLEHFGMGTGRDDVSAQVDALSPEALKAAYEKQKIIILADDIKRYYEEIVEFDKELPKKDPDFTKIAKKYSDDETTGYKEHEAREEKYHSLLKEWAKEEG